MRNSTFLLFLWVILTTLCLTGSQINSPCVTTLPSTTGQILTTLPPPHSVTNINQVTLLSSLGSINCQGLLRQWQFYKRPNLCDNVVLQVYRPDATNTNLFTLIGETPFNGNTDPRCTTVVTSGGVITVNVNVEDQIPVQPGDIIGWRQLSVNGMMGTDNTVLSQVRTRICTAAVSGTCTMDPATNMGVYLVALLGEGHTPSFDNLPSSTNLEEGDYTSNRPVIFTVYRSVKLNWNTVVMPTLTMQMTTGTQKFSFDDTTGQVSAIADFNYDTEPQQYVLNFLVHDGALSSTGSLTINILNVNRPHTIVPFPSPLVIAADQTPVGQTIYQVRVTDQDVTMVTQKTFLILSQNVSGLFTIDRNTGIITCAKDFNTLRRTFNKDNATWDTYDIEIDVVDDLHALNPTSILSIRIENLRVKPAIVGTAPRSTTVKENVLRGAEIYRVGVVVDNRRRFLKYEMLKIDPPNGWTKFILDPDSGAITVPTGTGTSQVFDYSDTNQQSYTLTVRAQDDLYKGDSVNVTVDIEWVNRPPLFPAPKYQEQTIEEELAVNKVVLTLTEASDRDVSAGLPYATPDNLTYTILPSIASAYFNICITGNQICIRDRIDIDAPANQWKQNMTFSVQVKDAAGASDTMDVRVFVTDINDNDPLFNQTSFTAKIKENSRGETPLDPPVTVFAPDSPYPDQGWNASIMYTLEDTVDGNMTMYFQVHPTNGHVTVQHPMDYESFNKINMRFVFQAMATDQMGEPTGNRAPTPATITVELLDVNDNRPKFTQGFYNLEVRDNILVTYVIVALTATDADTPAKSQVSYFKLIPEPDWDLHEDVGNVSVARTLKTDHKYLLYCYARDNGQQLDSSQPELLSEPSIVRIDSFSHWKYLVDITLGKIPKEIIPKEASFFIALNQHLAPWIVKKEGQKILPDRAVFTIYALYDNSTDSIDNIDQPKRFVHRDDLLGRLRKDILGTPRDDLKDKLKDFNPIRVMPTYPIWMLDTIPGIATLSALCFLGLLLIVLLIILLLRKFQLCCFKKKPAQVPVQKPVNAVVNKAYEEEFKLNYTKQPDDQKPLTPANNTTSLVENKDSNLRARPTRRPPSAQTIHSLIYVPHK